MSDTIFLKLGGSLITDKTAVETVRGDVLARAAREIAQARTARPSLRLVLGHGSGSFGHVAAARDGTRHGVQTLPQWRSFAEVSDAAARLNRRVVAELLAAGAPAVTLQPSASARVTDGHITHIAAHAVQAALDAGLVPVVYGDVAFDTVRGGTIISTEEVMMALAQTLRPSWLLLAGETEGVYGVDGRLAPQITAANFETIAPALGGSRGTDVTGGMASKVRAMLALVEAQPQMQIRIFSGLAVGNVQRVLQDGGETAVGTLIHHTG